MYFVHMFGKKIITIIIILLILFVALFASFRLSPWPMALMIRHAFNKEGVSVNEALTKYVPADITSMPDEQYIPRDSDAYLDAYFPAATSGETRLPALIWIHGGGFVSGSKDQVANYCRILAGKGYVSVAVDYSLAPRETYPTPVRQVNAALEYLSRNATRFHIDTTQFIFAGDSGGAHIAAQLANTIVNPSYASLLDIAPAISASQLSALLLYCGPYDTRHIKTDGEFGVFLKTVLWSYSGEKDFAGSKAFISASVIDYVDKNFPPSFISVGNADPLLSHSHALAAKLSSSGSLVDSLFFSPQYAPPLPHEYQFNLDTEAGHLALDSSMAFLKKYIKQ